MIATRRLAAWAVLAALSLACGLGPDDATARDIDQATGRSLRERVDCAEHRYYCDALDRFQRANAVEPRTEPFSLVGRALRLNGANGIWDAREEVDWLVAHRELMAFGEVSDETDQEREQLRELLEILRAGQPPPPDHPVALFVGQLAGSDDHLRYAPVHGRSRHDHNPLDHFDRYYRQSGDEIIAIEIRREAMAVAVFTRP
jgi:hypothetical protein